MTLQQNPIPGYWYSNLSSQLIQVRAILYTSGKRSHIILEDINSKREYVPVADWKGMDLVLHSPVVEQQHVARDS
ncbi:MAG: hypothetical protein U9P11_10435 [Pseudomonadota bacterium]|nr:hypothetical protein [Pseudomonadota bacterium]